MSFLNGALLPGMILLAGLPLLIHLLSLQFPRLFEFPTVRHLQKTIAQRSRLFRWRHLLLLALRTLFLIALILAFLRPVLPRLGSEATAETGRTVLLIIDHSLSMEHMDGGGGARGRAALEADKILSTLGSNDFANVLLAGETPTACFIDFSRQIGEARRFVQAIPPGFTRADFSAANAAASRLIPSDVRGAEIYYLSDFQRKNWANVDFTLLPPTTRPFFVDVGAADRGNHAILGAAFTQTQVLAGDTVSLEMEIGNFREAPLRESLRVVIDAQSSFAQEVSAAPWSTARVSLPIPSGGPGLHLCEIRLPSDALPADDRFFLTLQVVEKEGVLIVSDAAGTRNDAALFLRTALNPYDHLGGSLLPEETDTAGLNAEKIAGVRKMFFTHPGRLSAEAAHQVADFVFHGGGVVYFLDGDVDAENLAALESAAHARMPLQLGPKRAAENVGGDAQQILRGDFKSRFLQLFRGAQRQNLALLEFYDFHDASATGTGAVLLSYADGTPAMAQLDHGLGTLLLLNFSASELSSNLARQRMFPAWMQELVKNLASHEFAPASNMVGAAVTGEIWKRDLGPEPLRDPEGAPVLVKTEQLGERAAISFVPSAPGFYTLRRGSALLEAFAVNPSPDESDLRAVDRALLPEQLGEHAQPGFFVGGRDDFEDLVRGRPIFHWLILAGLTLLLIEMALQTWVNRTPAP